MASLAGRTLLVTGGSRGIGLAIAKRAAADGANIVIAAKTVEPHPKLPGTIYTAAEECKAAGAAAVLPLQVDIMDDEANERMVAAAVAEFGGIDILVNNASAIDNSGTLDVRAKKYRLMHDINGRGTFWTSKLCLPHLLKSQKNPHVLNLSPPLAMDPRWFRLGGVAYTMAKYNMSMSALGMAEEFKGQVAFNCLWPRTAIATAAIQMLAGDLGMKASRSVDIMSDAAHWILTQPHTECTGNTFIDDEVLTQHAGMDPSELSKYRMSSLVPLMPDFYVGDPATLDTYISGAKKMQGLMGGLVSKFGKKKPKD
jgi:citronellol/citronellal dehydrogenase